MRIQGKISQSTLQTREQLWTTLSQHHRKLYATSHPPGSIHYSLDQANTMLDTSQVFDHFMVYDLIIDQIESLQLATPEMQRTLFTCRRTTDVQDTLQEVIPDKLASNQSVVSNSSSICLKIKGVHLTP